MNYFFLELWSETRTDSLLSNNQKQFYNTSYQVQLGMHNTCIGFLADFWYADM